MLALNLVDLFHDPDSANPTAQPGPTSTAVAARQRRDGQTLPYACCPTGSLFCPLCQLSPESILTKLPNPLAHLHWQAEDRWLA